MKLFLIKSVCVWDVYVYVYANVKIVYKPNVVHVELRCVWVWELILDEGTRW